MIKALVLGEEERGQSQYQVMCFLTKLQTGDFISSDAMAKLRQVGRRRHRQHILRCVYHTLVGWGLINVESFVTPQTLVSLYISLSLVNDITSLRGIIIFPFIWVDIHICFSRGTLNLTLMYCGMESGLKQQQRGI